VIHGVILFLLATPSFGVLTPFIGFYFPDEKIALAIILYLLSRKGAVKVYRLQLFAILMAILVMLRMVVYQDFIFNMADFNLVYMLGMMPYYLKYFTDYYKSILKYLPLMAFLQIAVSVFQQSMMHLNYPEMATILNNYPPQANLKFGISADRIFYRVSGLFNESSQYAMFLVIFVIMMIEEKQKLAKLSRFEKLIIVLALFEIGTNHSITAYVAISIYLIVLIARNLSLKNFFKILIVSPVGVWALSKPIGNIIDEVIQKIELTLFLHEGFPRLNQSIIKIQTVIDEGSLLGYGNTWSVVSWDFISVYLYGYGILGFLAILIYFFAIVKKMNLITAIPFVALLVSNGNILATIIIFAITFPYAAKKNSKMLNLQQFRKAPG
jgi:hypothetical protein